MSLNISDKLLSIQDTIANKLYLLGAWTVTGSLTLPGWVGADGRNFSERAHYWLANMTVMELLGLVALLLLIVERYFVVWARCREWRRQNPNKPLWALLTIPAVIIGGAWLLIGG